MIEKSLKVTISLLRHPRQIYADSKGVIELRHYAFGKPADIVFQPLLVYGADLLGKD